ncbi:MAG: GTP-binding protein [Candidatus Thermoplasmatota archaeon]|nr:GTP-binding protein [Candidatus Thermoplasmatota archaeon]MCL5963798.1 GTP-binding protein [Candidatus Thermoplasmatota archaeon]
MAKIDDDIKRIDDELKKTIYNKKTQHHIGKLKAKLAFLKMEAERRRSSHSSSGLRYAVKKSGNGTVALLGFPSVGKSTILNKLTNAFSEIGAYDFTTITIVPGSMSYKGANIQILDMPGIIEGASDGRGRGKAVISVARTSDLILLIVDPVKSSISALIKEAESANIKLNGYKPNIVITPKTKGGGLKIVSTVKLTHIDEQLIGEVVREWGIVNGEVIIREDVTVDQLIDVLSGNRVYIPAIVVVNKSDLLTEENKGRIMKEIEKYNMSYILTSAETGHNMEYLKELMYEKLNFISIYLKPPGKEADMMNPLIIKKGTTVRMLCELIHKEFVKQFRYGQIWGKSAKFPGQIVGFEHVLYDKDVITIHTKRTE